MTGDYSLGFWQPQVAVNPRLPIQLLLLNQAGIPLIYEPTIGTSVKEQSQLRPRGTATINVVISHQTGDIASILIHASTELDALHFEFAARDNTILVLIRRAGAEKTDKAVNIDEKGRVYAF